MSSKIHPTAVIHASAKIGAGVEIGPYAVIGEGCVIGDGTVIGAHATVEFTQMGRENRLLPGCHVGGPPQDLKFKGEPSILRMGDKNTVRECVTLNRGTAATGETVIGSGCLFMAYSHVAHDCRIGNGVVLVNSVGIAGHVEIGDFTVVGGIVGIHQYVRIGRFCMIGGGSMVGKDVPSFCTCQGDRARLRGLNLIGMRRAGLSRDAVREIREAYKTLFLSGFGLEDAVAKLKQASPCAEIAEMIEFIERSPRGVMRPAVGAEAEEEVTI